MMIYDDIGYNTLYIWATLSPGRSYFSTRTMALLHGTKKMALKGGITKEKFFCIKEKELSYISLFSYIKREYNAL